jgi:hypothetical protein
MYLKVSRKKLQDMKQAGEGANLVAGLSFLFIFRKDEWL